MRKTTAREALFWTMPDTQLISNERFDKQQHDHYSLYKNYLFGTVLVIITYK